MSYYSRRYVSTPRQGTRRRRNTKTTNTQSRYITDLKRLYPLCKHDDANVKQECAIKYADHKITYGEMTYEGLEMLYQHVLKLDNNMHPFIPHCFIDVGSGRGKLCLYMAEKANISQSIGIELVKSRYDDAEQFKQRLGIKFPEYTRKTTFINSNIFDISVKQCVRSSPVLVWFSNLCFDQQITDKIFEKLIAELPSGSIICCSKIPLMNMDNCKSLGIVEIPMSWTGQSKVSIYQT